MLFSLNFLVWTYAAPCRPAHFLSNFFPMLSSDSPGTLSHSLPKSPSLLATSFLVTLQALSLSFLPKSQNLLYNQITKSHLQRNCNLLSHAAPALSHIFHAYHYCQEPYRPHICQIYHTAMGHRSFNPAMTSDICLRYAHAAEESAFASRSPIPRDDRGTLS